MERSHKVATQPITRTAANLFGCHRSQKNPATAKPDTSRFPPRQDLLFMPKRPPAGGFARAETFEADKRSSFRNTFFRDFVGDRTEENALASLGLAAR